MTLRQIRNERGILTLDFMFASVLIIVFFFIFFALSFSLSVVSITQYFAYAASRNFMASNFTLKDQQDLARKKFNQLKNSKTFKGLYSNGWFELGDLEVSGTTNFAQEYNASGVEKSVFVGVRVPLKIKVLEFRFPLFGNTYTEEDQFTVRLTSFLSREPTSSECEEFFQKRFGRIQDLKGGSGSSLLNNMNAPADAVMLDNGC